MILAQPITFHNLNLSKVLIRGYDLIYVVDTEVAFRFTNMHCEKGPITVRGIIEELMRIEQASYALEQGADGKKKEKLLRKRKKKRINNPFGLENFDVRCDDSKIYSHERIKKLEDKRIPHLFFDTEEQKFVQNIVMRRYALYSNVEIHCRSIEEEEDLTEPFALSSLFEITDKKLKSKVLKEMKKLKIVGVLQPEEYILYSEALVKRNKERKTKYTQRTDKKVDFLKTIFTMLPNLQNIISKKEFNRYFRLMKAKYHPDKSKTGDGNIDSFLEIKGAEEDAKKTEWYKKLPE